MLLYHLYYSNANELKRLAYKFLYVVLHTPKYMYIPVSHCVPSNHSFCDDATQKIHSKCSLFVKKTRTLEAFQCGTAKRFQNWRLVDLYLSLNSKELHDTPVHIRAGHSALQSSGKKQSFIMFTSYVTILDSGCSRAID